MKITIQVYKTLLTRYLGPMRGSVYILAVLVLVNIALQLINPQIVRTFIDTAQAGGALEVLIQQGICLWQLPWCSRCFRSLRSI
jgi:ATP-binding cassette, subfamily B, bacterial